MVCMQTQAAFHNGGGGGNGGQGMPLGMPNGMVPNSGMGGGGGGQQG
jgi:hypothetical protein